MKYDSYKFIFPPRPEVMISYASIDQYDTGEYCGQPKLNGDACIVATNGKELVVRNRHNEVKTRVDKNINLLGLHKCEEWIVVAGELLDKSQRGEDGEVLKGFAIWDILVWNSTHLIDSTFQERLHLLENIWPSQRMKVDASGITEYKHLCFTDLELVYRVPTYLNGFAALYTELVMTDVYEGVVLKKLNGKLEMGFNEKNNSGWQLKVRKPTKIYKF